MIKAVDLIFCFKNKIKIESVYNFSMVFIVLSILVLSTLFVMKPINSKQLLALEFIAAQSKFPLSQEAAWQVLQQKHITFGQYLKLVYAYQSEERKAKELPAVSFDKNYHVP